MPCCSVRIVPLRIPVLWSEALLNAARKSPSDPKGEMGSPEPLVPRNMHDSYSEIILPFGSSSRVMEEYTNASGGIRTGK